MTTTVRPTGTSVAVYGVYITGVLRGYVAPREGCWVAFGPDYQIIEPGRVFTCKARAIQAVREFRPEPARRSTREHLFHLVSPIFPLGHR